MVRQKNQNKDVQSVFSNQTEFQGKKTALNLFHLASERVPAYKNFLKKNRINADKVKTYNDFTKVPYTDKENYINSYSIRDLSWDGNIADHVIIHSSSGTAGEPYFWTTSRDDFEIGKSVHQAIFQHFDAHSRKTLVVICFGMGTWIAGVYTLMSTFLASHDAVPLAMITPGFNKKESIAILKKIAPEYDQTIIAGYPTFVKDVLDGVKDKKLLKKLNLKFIFAGEGFTESWRDYVLNMCGSKKAEDMVSIIGSADCAIMGFETSLSIGIRRFVYHHGISKEIFGREQVPSLAQFLPTHRWIEEQEGEIILTGNKHIPLLRYNIHDSGGIFSSKELHKRLKKFNYPDEYFNTDVDRASLPFFYIFGRSKFNVLIFAAHIYSENIKEVLIHRSVYPYLTGNFIPEVKHTAKFNQRLILHVELAEKVKSSVQLKQSIENLFVRIVPKFNSEYAKIYSEYGDKVKPEVSLYMYGDEKKFNKTVFKKTS